MAAEWASSALPASPSCVACSAPGWQVASQCPCARRILPGARCAPLYRVSWCEAAVVCREQQYVLQDSQAAVALVSHGFREALQPVAAASGAHLHVLTEEASSESSSQHEHAQQAVQRALRMQQRDEQGALILFTSGTTGRPKGALRLPMAKTHRRQVQTFLVTHGHIRLTEACICLYDWLSVTWL